LRGERAGWAILFAVLLTGMHLVTARTGLLGFYGAFAVGMLIWLIRQRRWRLGVGVMIMGMAVPLVAYQLSSAVQNKVAITIKDLRNYAEGGDLSHWSLGRRLAVYETSWHMIRKRPFRGWEASFLQTHLIQQYEQEQFRLAREWRLLDPHNQYLMMLLITGVGGLVVFLSMFVLPWLRLRPHSFGAFSMFLALQLSGFLVESILNRQIGIGLFCFFYLFLQGLRYDASGTRTPADTSICSSHAE
jgi:O-antigen ligase